MTLVSDCVRTVNEVPSAESNGPIATLPNRIEPRRHESWRGYTHRAARFYDVSWFGLLSPVLGRCATRSARRRAGIYASPSSARRLAEYFRLSSDEVQEMHLAVFEGSAITIGADLAAQFDPFADPETRVTLRVSRCGPVPNCQRQAVCWQCRADEPDWLPLEWCLTWFPVCAEHGILLSRDPKTRIGADPDVLKAQEVLRSWLPPSPGNAFVFEHLTQVVKDLLGVAPSSLVSAREPAEIASVLPQAVRAVATPGFPEAQCLSARFPRMSRPAIQVLRAIEPIRRGPVEPRQLDQHPRALPNSLFAGAVSDLLGSTVFDNSLCSLARVRAEQIGSITTAMARFGLSLEGATPDTLIAGERRLARLRRCVLDVLAQLERVGRLESFWYAIGDAASQLDLARVDYAQRWVLVCDQTFLNELLFESSIDRRLAKIWLEAEWAGEPVLAEWWTAGLGIDAWLSQLRDLDAPLGRLLNDAASQAMPTVA